MISAVIPVRDPAPTELEEALDSLRQARLVGEIILVDDGCPEHVLRKHAEQGCRVILSRGRGSASTAKATGVHAARGDYVLSMDSDDLIFNEGLNLAALAPVNLAKNNSPHQPPASLFRYLDRPVPVQWGSVVETNLARTLAASCDTNAQEDLAWGYRLYLTAWKDQLTLRRNAGVRYHWRAAQGRPSLTTTTNRLLSEGATAALLETHLAVAMRQVGLKETPQAICGPQVRVFERGQRVDTHVLSYLGEPAWLGQCIASIEHEPTNLQLVMGGFPGSIGQARAYAFTLGMAEYVSFLDDDDYVLPGVTQKCIDYLDNHHGCVGVYTDRYHLHADGRLDPEVLPDWHWRRAYHGPAEITHLKVMRREVVSSYIDELNKWPTYEEYVLCNLMVEQGYWHHLPVFGAVKRFKDPSESSMRLSSSALLAAAKKRVLPSLKRYW